MTAIALPERKILVPPLTFPRWLRHGRARVTNMLAPLGGALSPLTVSGVAANPLASVPWVAQWKFNNDGNDSIGSNHLTNNNSATFTTGKIGGATGATQLTAASSQYWSIADNAALSMGDIDFTICVWVYADTFAGSSGNVIAWKGADASLAVIEFGLLYYSVGGVNRFRFAVGNGSTGAGVNASTAGAPSTATWYCVIASHDAVNNLIGISVNDGAVDTTSYSGGGQDTASAMRIGRFITGDTWNWNGRIDNVCIAKSAAGGGGVLSAAQRTAFYNNGNGTETLT